MGRNLHEPPPNPGVPSRSDDNDATAEWGKFGEFVGKVFCVVMCVLALAVIVSFGIKLIIIIW